MTYFGNVTDNDTENVSKGNNDSKTSKRNNDGKLSKVKIIQKYKKERKNEKEIT